MKYTLYTIFLVLLISACSDKIELDDSQAKTFNKLYGNSGDDRGVEIKELDDGSFLIFGTIETSDKSTELALIKTDRFGNEQWTKTFGRDAEDIAGGMDIDDNGNIIIAGTSIISGTTEEDSNHTDVIVIELDNSGNVTNTDIYSNLLANEKANCVLFDRGAFGGYFVGGSTDALRLATPDFPQNNRGIKDFLYIRKFINEQGQLEIRDQQIGFRENDEISSVIQLEADTNFLFAGVSQFNDINRPFVAKISNTARNSSTNGFKRFDDIIENVIINDIHKINENQFSIIGSAGNQNTRLIIKFLNDQLVNIPDEDISITKNGSIRGYNMFFNQQANNFLVSGSTNAEGLAKGGGFDHYIASISLDSINGNTINWEETYGGTGEEEALAIAPTKDGGYIITGYTGFEGNSLINTIKVDNKGILNP